MNENPCTTRTFWQTDYNNNNYNQSGKETRSNTMIKLETEVNDVPNNSNVIGLEMHNIDDILPSFEMHNFMFNRTLSEFRSLHHLPPVYTESTANSLCSSTNIYDDPCASLPESTELLFDNLGKLQTIDVPVKIEISLVKEIPEIGRPYQIQNPLKHYIPGEILHGIATFENTSSIDLPFEMILISMECEVGIKSIETNKQLKKKIIATYDLEASCNHGKDSSNFNLTNDIHSLNESRIRFNSKGVLPSRVPVKKFFKFKIPSYLLDENCNDQLHEHLNIVPSFGLNKYSYQGKASKIGIDNKFGYGMLDKKGTPLKVNDYSLDGEFCSYFIKAQVIGKHIDAYNLFHDAKITQQQEYIFHQTAEHHFRVGSLSFAPSKTNQSTRSQLKCIENTLQSTIDLLKEKKVTQKSHVNDSKENKSATHETIVKHKHEKDLKNFTTKELDEKNSNIESHYERFLTTFLSKGILFKNKDTLKMKCKLNKNATIENILPPDMIIQKPCIPTNIDYIKAASPKFKIELELDTFDGINKTLKLPRSIHIKPSLIAIDIQSQHNIPFTIDNNFFFEDIDYKRYFEKFRLYYNILINLLKKDNATVFKSVANLMKGMAYLNYTEIEIPYILKPKTISLENEWKFDVDSRTYKCSIETAFELDFNYILRNPLALLPTFQTCIFSRSYKIKTEILANKFNTQVLSFPITVI